MENQVTLKAPSMPVILNNDFKVQNEHGIRILTSEEILAVAGGPEVDIETGGAISYQN